MKKLIFKKFYVFALPIAVIISCVINIMVIAGLPVLRYYKLGMLLVLLCSTAYLIRQIIISRLSGVPIINNELSELLHNKKLVKLLSRSFIVTLIVWAVSLFIIMIR